MKTYKERFFPHDFNASRDDKILRLRARFKAAGVGLYWMVVEYLYTQGGTAPFDMKIIAKAIGEDVRTVGKFLMVCVEDIPLFKTNGTEFWSERVRQEIARILETSKRNSQSACIRHSRSVDIKTFSNHELGGNESQREEQFHDARAVHADSERSAIRKEIIDKLTNKTDRKAPYGEFQNVLLTPEEVSKCIDNYGQCRTDQAIDKLSRYKASTGKTYQSDFATLLRWAFKDSEPTNKATSASEDAFIPRHTQSIFADDEGESQERP